MIFILGNGVAAKHQIYMINLREKNIYFEKYDILNLTFKKHAPCDLKYNLNTKKILKLEDL